MNTLKFCDVCSSRFTKRTTEKGVVFECVCGNTREGKPEDSLMFEVNLRSGNDVMIKQETFIQLAAHDPAGLKVAQDCPQCKMDYMTMIRIGDTEKAIYTCDCGYIN